MFVKNTVQFYFFFGPPPSIPCPLSPAAQHLVATVGLRLALKNSICKNESGSVRDNIAAKEQSKRSRARKHPIE